MLRLFCNIAEGSKLLQVVKGEFCSREDCPCSESGVMIFCLFSIELNSITLRVDINARGKISNCIIITNK